DAALAVLRGAGALLAQATSQELVAVAGGGGKLRHDEQRGRRAGARLQALQRQTRQVAVETRGLEPRTGTVKRVELKGAAPIAEVLAQEAGEVEPVRVV